MNERQEEAIYREGYRRGYEDGRKSVKTKTIQYFDEDKKVWTIGEVIVDE